MKMCVEHDTREVKTPALNPLYNWLWEQKNAIYVCGFMYGEVHCLTEEQHEEFLRLYNENCSKPLVESTRRVGFTGLPLDNILTYRSFFTNPDALPGEAERQYVIRAIEKVLAEPIESGTNARQKREAYEMVLERVKSIPSIADEATWSVRFRYDI